MTLQLLSSTYLLFFILSLHTVQCAVMMRYKKSNKSKSTTWKNLQNYFNITRKSGSLEATYKNIRDDLKLLHWMYICQHEQKLAAQRLRLTKSHSIIVFTLLLKLPSLWHKCDAFWCFFNTLTAHMKQMVVMFISRNQAVLCLCCTTAAQASVRQPKRGDKKIKWNKRIFSGIQSIFYVRSDSVKLKL